MPHSAEKNAGIEKKITPDEPASSMSLCNVVTIEQKNEIDDMSEYTSLLEKDVIPKKKKVASILKSLIVRDIAHESRAIAVAR